MRRIPRQANISKQNLRELLDYHESERRRLTLALQPSDSPGYSKTFLKDRLERDRHERFVQMLTTLIAARDEAHRHLRIFNTNKLNQSNENLSC